MHNKEKFELTTPWQAFVDALFAVLLVIILVAIIFIIYRTFYEEYYDVISKGDKELEITEKEQEIFKIRTITKDDIDYELFDINDTNNKLTATMTFYHSLLSKKMYDSLVKYASNKKNIVVNMHYSSEDIKNIRANLYNYLIKLINNANKTVKTEVSIKLHQNYDKNKIIIEFKERVQ